MAGTIRLPRRGLANTVDLPRVGGHRRQWLCVGSQNQIGNEKLWSYPILWPVPMSVVHNLKRSIDLVRLGRVEIVCAATVIEPAGFCLPVACDQFPANPSAHPHSKCVGTLAQECENGCGTASATTDGHPIRWPLSSLGRCTDVDVQARAVVDRLAHRHPQAAERAAKDPRGPAADWKSSTPNAIPARRYGCWPATPTLSPKLVGLTDVQCAGGDADAELVARWLDDGITPNGAHRRAFSACGVHGFDLTFCRTQERVPDPGTAHRRRRRKSSPPHTTRLSGGDGVPAPSRRLYPGAQPDHREKDLQRLPGLVAIAYQHETSRCGDPHLHTHVIVPNRQPVPTGVLVSIDGTSLYHEARAAGVIYQAALRREHCKPAPARLHGVVAGYRLFTANDADFDQNLSVCHRSSETANLTAVQEDWSMNWRRPAEPFGNPLVAGASSGHTGSP